MKIDYIKSTPPIRIPFVTTVTLEEKEVFVLRDFLGKIGGQEIERICPTIDKDKVTEIYEVVIDMAENLIEAQTKIQEDITKFKLDHLYDL